MSREDPSPGSKLRSIRIGFCLAGRALAEALQKAGEDPVLVAEDLAALREARLVLHFGKLRGKCVVDRAQEAVNVAAAG